ncbi:uncharacterized protein TRAVEDRAFT_22691 [Trametes versicolor FP-101664 SS1]|uniref:uncharacterized protein n=1 Tax=Trametes versicolor (strain FP-101664) TaxID=717944 RepID=UPI0004622828|nr:uncharacterized protein TRAVEDRAFT_22691 [Trametes versicolor FP-101664 SS1]EIW54814.1 hypothetical protein TRAVEDRAFT_22691 [Trametes versicolor FP-101664 SS1]
MPPATPSRLRLAQPVHATFDDTAVGPKGYPALRERSRQSTRTVALACLNCREIKKKCSGGNPCRPCIEKGKAHTCVRATKKIRVRAGQQTLPSEPAGLPSLPVSQGAPVPVAMASAPAPSADAMSFSPREVGSAHVTPPFWSTVGHSGEQYPMDVNVLSGAGGWQCEMMNTASEGYHPRHWVEPASDMAAFGRGQYMASNGAYQYDAGIAAFQSTGFGAQLPQLFFTF